MATANTCTVVLFLLLLLRISTVDSVLLTDTVDNIVPNSGWIVEPPDIAVAIRDRPYTLQCHSDLPNVTYQWMYNNHILDLVNDSRRKILSNGSLFFNKVLHKKPGDAGSYRCIVQTTYGSIVSKTVTLQIAVLRDFDISPNNVTVSSEASRSVIRLTCHINSTPEATITWLKNDAIVPSSKKFITKVPGVLYIKNVDEKDSGNYRCMAKNYLLNKTRLSDAGYLNVENINAESFGSQSDIQPLSFISPTYLYPNVKYVTAGDNITFECAASGVPSPQLNWSFTTSTGNKQNTKISDVELFVNILSLTNVSSENSGIYTCLAFQPLIRWPDFAHTQTFRLEVMMPPIITIRPETQSMPIVKTIRFKCGADGNPYPNISWYHNGERLKSNGRVKIKEKQFLIVSNTVSKDSGIYQCFASNPYGTTWVGAMFTISPSPFEPAPPTNISCRTLSLSQIQLSWQMSPTDVSNDPPILFRDDSIQLVPSHSSVSSASSSSATVSTDKISRIIRIYTVHYMLTDGGDEVQNITEDHSIIIENLKPYQNYTFYVRVYNGKSGSDESEKVICRTQDKAPQTTLDLTIFPLSPISLSVEWPIINVNLINGAVTQYQILWKLFHSSSNYVQILHENTRHYTITGLKPGGQYEVKVLGIAQNGLPSIDFPWHLVDLPHIDTSLPKPILTFTVGQTIKLSWSVKHVHFDYYKLMYRVTGKTNQSEMLLFTFSPDKNDHIINYTSDLEVYEVLLNCVSNNRQGESVFRTIAVVLDILSPPSQIEAVATSFHSLNLSWVPPDSVDLSSLLFIITYNSVSNYSQNSTTIFTDLGVTSLEISGLRPYSLYEIKISAHDKNNRKSEFSQKIQIRTLQGVPGIVEQIEWHWINNYTVRITWVEPINSNGVITGYYVLYTSELHVPPTSWQQLNVSQHKHSLDVRKMSKVLFLNQLLIVLIYFILYYS
uniref:Protogenin n=1 Tax=Sipha flava TaxID=143950 RepID=A0A2S2PYT6_9HEMI